MFWLLFVLPLKLDLIPFGAQSQDQQISPLTAEELGKVTQISHRLITKHAGVVFEQYSNTFKHMSKGVSLKDTDI